MVENKPQHLVMWYSQMFTLAIGIVAFDIALPMTNVLDLMLCIYAFMVSCLLVPLIGGLFWNLRKPTAALASMVLGWGGDRYPFSVDGIVFGFRSKFLRFNRIIYRIFVNKLDQYKEEYK